MVALETNDGGLLDQKAHSVQCLPLHPIDAGITFHYLIMIFEIAKIEILDGKESEFEQAVQAASNYFKIAKGYISLALERSIEKPSQYRLKVGWETVEDHLVTFRESQGFQEWRKLASPYFASPPQVEHIKIVFHAD